MKFLPLFMEIDISDDNEYSYVDAPGGVAKKITYMAPLQKGYSTLLKK